MSPLSEIGVVAQRELRKSFSSAKGIALLVLSLLGGTGATLLLVKAQELKREKMGDVTPEMLHTLREKGVTEIYGDPATGKALADAPEVLLVVLLLTVWLTPLIIGLLSFDAVSGDMQHKTVRYWTLRTRRWSYFIGKWAGLWGTVSAITFAMHAVIWIVCVIRGEAPFASAFGWGLRFWLVTLPISAAWCALATLVGSFFKTPMVSLLVIFASFFVVWLVWMIGQVSHTEALTYIYPNTFDSFLVNPRPDRVGAGLAACVGTAALYLGIGSFFMKKRDV